MMFRPSDQIGPYTLVRELGRGTFGVVWLAERRTRLATTQLALKLPLLDDPDLDAITREARLWVQASGHPNVLPVVEAEVYDGQVVIVSEYAPDGALRAWLRQNGGRAPSVEVAVTVAAGILAGLAHLHWRGLVHRDLKPGNILLQGGTPRIADFGLARVLTAVDQTSGVAGTPAYMAPEAWDGVRSVQTDLWSVGVVLYEMLSGCRPFPQTDRESLRRAILESEPAPLPAEISGALRHVVLRALHKDPDRRYQSADDMLSDLRGCFPLVSPSVRGLSQRANGLRTTPLFPAAIPSESPLVIVYDTRSQDKGFQEWGVYSTVGGVEKRIRLMTPSGPISITRHGPEGERASALLQLRAFRDEQVGINKAFPHLVGKARFEYQAVHSGSPNPNLLFCVIPMQPDRSDGKQLIEVGARHPVEPENAYSPYRERFFVPVQHIGDGLWHLAEIVFDFPSIPTTAYTILAPRINEGCPRPGPGTLLVRNVQLLVPGDLETTG
jgi:serine/threonine protein kinase